MSDGYERIVSSGVIVPDTATLQADVEAEFKAALGNDLNTDPSTPQGQLITGEVIARSKVLQNNAALANQINPTIAGGIFLQAICQLTGLEPPGPSYTTVVGVTLTGSPSFIIAAGAQAKTAAGDLFQLTDTVTIGAGGSVTGTFQAVESGPIPCAAHALSIATAVLGWDTVDNATAGTLGEAAPSDAELRALRLNTLGLQAESIPAAITSALYDTPGVRSLQFLENRSLAGATIQTIVMVGKSIWVCVDGGTDLAVATALLTKTLGPGFNGAVTVNVTDPSSGQIYAVKFDRPTPTRIYARATIRTGSITGDATTIVKNDLLAYAAGSVSGFDGFTVGGDVSPFELAMSIGAQTPGAYVVKMEVSLDGVTWVTTTIDLTIAQQGTLAVGDITVLFV